MSDTVGNMIIRVLRRTLQNPAKTGVSDNDDTQLILDLLNEANEQIRDLFPTTVDADASFTLPAATRVIAIPVSGLDIYDIYDWSWQYTDTNGKQAPLTFATTQLIYQTYPNYASNTANYPQYVYFDNNQIAFYPFLTAGLASLTGTFKYPALAGRKTAWSDTFPYPNNWLKWMELYAQFFYESTKGLGNPPATEAAMEVLYGRIFGKTKKARRIGFVGSRKYPKRRYGANGVNPPNVW